MTLRWSLTPHMLMAHVQLYPRIVVSSSHGNTSKYVDTVTIFHKLTKRSMTPRWPFPPLLLGSHVWLYLRIIVSLPWKYIKVCGDYFSKTLTKRSMTQMTPRWPLTPLLLRSHGPLYPRIRGVSNFCLAWTVFRKRLITHSVCSMCICSMWYFTKLIPVSTYIDVFPWDLDTMILG